MISRYFQYSYILCFMIGLTTCVKCPPIIKHSIIAQCKYKGNEFPCTKSVEPGTIAQTKCAFLYKKITNSTTLESEYLHCQKDGTWSEPSFECEQICGTIGTKVAFSVNSQITEVEKVPWQVAVYMKDFNGMLHHICGGTLIQSNVIISAAHCFWNSLKSQLYNESNYVIAAGKFYRDFYANNESSAFQVSDVLNIKIPASFSGADYDFVSDIAIVTLKRHIVFKNHIRPACLPWNVDKYSVTLNNKSGVVAGWGVTNTGTYSPELRSVELTSIDSDDCKKKVTKDNKIPNDKFCVNINEGKNVCRGDSGGGFLVPISKDDEIYYYLWGIVSNGLIGPRTSAITCNSNFVTTFTNVQLYQGFVTQSKIFFSDNEYNSACLVPEILPNLLDIEIERILASGTYVKKDTKIKYICPFNYILVGNYTTNTCNEDWLNPHPECIRGCLPLYERSIISSCYYKEKKIDCSPGRLLPGTIAKIECAFMYKKPLDKLFYETITCHDNHLWDNMPIQCEPICGTIESKLEIEYNNTESINKKIPWQVSIYFRNNKEMYEYICSGTLVHSKVVLTAARCFWDSKNSSLYDISNYIVTAGNFYRNYYATQIEEVQSSNISDIQFFDSFSNSANGYSLKIAVLTLNDHIIFQNHIRPACLMGKDQNNITDDKLGVIADWRMNNIGIYNSHLFPVDLFYCENKKTLSEEVCAKINYEKGKYSGDNGSGLLVPKIISNVTYYHLLGIFTNNFQTESIDLNRCNSNVTIIFNNILNLKPDVDIIINKATGEMYSPLELLLDML